jgi:hypothetical protein
MAAQIRRLSRRALLRGAGAALALPWLTAMEPRSARAAAEVVFPKRLGVLFFPNGVWVDSWVPDESGPGYELPFSLEPLGPIKSDVLVISGLDKKNSHGGDGHYAKTANFLTGMHVEKTVGKNISSGGMSLDQLIAREIGDQTPLPSLELGIDPVISGIDSNVGYTRLYGSHISWLSANRPLAKEINPRLVYERLMGVSRRRAGGQDASQLDRRNLLDLTLGEAHRLRKSLGRDDQFKLDEYLDAVRAIERQIEFFEKGSAFPQRVSTMADAPREIPPAEIPTDYAKHVSLMFDLMALAYQSDATRTLTFMFGNDVSPRSFSFVDGVQGAHHEISHHENKAEKVEQYRRINRWHVQQYAHFLQKLATMREGAGTVLDHSFVLLGCGFSDGNKHDPANLPILLAGRGGGEIESGRHIACSPGTPLCNLYLSMLQTLGIPAEQFGDSSQPLSL